MKKRRKVFKSISRLGRCVETLEMLHRRVTSFGFRSKNGHHNLNPRHITVNVAINQKTALTVDGPARYSLSSGKLTRLLSFLRLFITIFGYI